ncbi:c-type cytochrome [Formosa sp. S-31]|uniref:c-type cytochrome n=1 Tax=Formosa sp. S-31 TaxID=2790949 RepID=UPI003EBA958A
MRHFLHFFYILILLSGLTGSINSCQSKAEPKLVPIDAATYFKSGTNIPLPDAKFQVTEQRIARGDYLANGILKCFSCHSDAWNSHPGDSLFEARKGSGRKMFETDSTLLYSMNITPDTLTGIGSYTDAEITNAIRKGIGKDGRKLADMPTLGHAQLTNEDVVALVVYLRSLKPIEKEIPKRKFTKMMEAGMNFDPFLSVTDTLLPEPNMSDLLERGKYLASIGVCVGCHTAFEGGKPKLFAGGTTYDTREGLLYSPNISSDSTGISKWTKASFIELIKTGKSGTLHDVMPWRYYNTMTDDDLTAIYLALKQTYPVKHQVAKGYDATYCVVCNTTHGLGNTNTSIVLQPTADSISEDISGTYNSLLTSDVVQIEKRDDKYIATAFGIPSELVPIANDYYYADNLYAPIRFIKDGETITGLKIKTLFNNPYKKQE